MNVARNILYAVRLIKDTSLDFAAAMILTLALGIRPNPVLSAYLTPLFFGLSLSGLE